MVPRSTQEERKACLGCRTPKTIDEHVDDLIARRIRSGELAPISGQSESGWSTRRPWGLMLNRPGDRRAEKNFPLALEKGRGHLSPADPIAARNGT